MELDLNVFGKFAKNFKKNEMIFSEFEPGENFYFIHSGSVKIVKIINNFEKNLDILNEGEFFGEMAILEDVPRSASAISNEDSVLLEFNKKNFHTLMAGNPQMSFMLLKIFTKRIFDQKRRIMTLTLKDDISRIYDVFLMLYETKIVQFEEGENMKEVTFYIKPNDIAHWAALPEAKADGIIRSLVSQKKLQLYESKVVVTNILDFKRFVNNKRKG